MRGSESRGAAGRGTSPSRGGALKQERESMGMKEIKRTREIAEVRYYEREQQKQAKVYELPKLVSSIARSTSSQCLARCMSGLRAWHGMARLGVNRFGLARPGLAYLGLASCRR